MVNKYSLDIIFTKRRKVISGILKEGVRLVGGRRKIRKIRVLVLATIIILIGVLITSYFNAAKEKKIGTNFIKVMINDETYKMADGKIDKLKEIMNPYFTEEDYKKFLDDVVGYMYPHLFYITNTDSVVIKKIKCTKVSKSKENNRILLFDVKYLLYNKKNKKTLMHDVISIEFDKNDKIKEVIPYNTSDMIKKLFLNVKVQ